MMLTERELTIGLVMYVLGKIIGFGFGMLHGRKKWND